MKVEKTYVPKGQIAGKWHLIDAEGESLGRLATQIATLLIGKHNVDFTPGVVMQDHVVVINAEKISANLTRQEQKIYYHHTLYPGGLREIDFKTQMERHPDRILRAAVRGMLPKNRLTARYLDNLKIYAGAEHPHAAQQPQPYEKA
ncbi:MAG: 50S ribosomal protein L13 [Chloroflexi bacterium]|nr:50S ribosomal protein L13 [Chloroflexota bacterium]